MKQHLPRIFTFFFAFLITPLGLFAQSELIKGRVLDAETQEPLAFVNIALAQTGVGTTTNIDGFFSINVKEGHERMLLLSYVGYEKKKIKAENPSLLIYLKRESKELNEVVVFAGENPAYRIIRKANKNRHLNDPYKLASFRLKTYNKFVFTLTDKDSLQKTNNFPSNTYKENKPLSAKKQEKLAKKEMELMQMDSLLRKQHLFMSETVTEKKFLFPNHHHEKVLGNKISGFKNPLSFTLANSFQPFAFYEDNIVLLDKKHLNPISKGSIKKYEFFIEDTTFYNQDTVYIISFEPRKGQKFDGLKGMLYISTDKYAIKNVIAENVDKDAKFSFKIQQEYEKIGGAYFPVQFNTDLIYNTDMNLGGRKLTGMGRSYIKDLEINPPLNKGDFNEVALEISESSLEKADEWLEKYRYGNLNEKELSTYVVLDSLLEKSSVHKLMKGMEYLFQKAIPIGPLDIGLKNIVSYNEYEGTRFGLGLKTNSKLSQLMNVEADVAYGFRDKAMKYGTALDLHLYKKKDIFLRFSFRNDVKEAGQQEFLRKDQILSTETFRDFFAFRFDSIREQKILLNYRPFAYSQAQISLTNTFYNPAYNYSFGYDEGDASTLSAFTVSELSFNFRYAHGETYYGFLDKKIFAKHSLPLMNFRISKGINNFYKGQFDYWKLDFRLTENIDFHTFGLANITLAAGYIHGDLPYSLLYNGRGALMNGNLLLTENMFQTMGLYEFVSDRYINVFHDHNFGNLFIRNKFSRPEFVFVNNIGFGALRNESMHQGIQFKTMEKGYFESGFRLDNLFRINYLDLLYFNFGAAVFHRYGYYQKANPVDNWAARMTMNFSF